MQRAREAMSASLTNIGHINDMITSFYTTNSNVPMTPSYQGLRDHIDILTIQLAKIKQAWWDTGSGG